MGATSDQAIEAAWKRYSLVNEAIARVDGKASIMFGLQSAIGAAAIAFSDSDRALANLTGGRVVWFRVGVVAVVGGIALCSAVVLPQLRHHAMRREYAANTLFFGHLRFWAPAELAEALEDTPHADELEMLTRQLVTVSRIAWRKHRFLQISILVFAAGVAVLALLAALG